MQATALGAAPANVFGIMLHDVRATGSAPLATAVILRRFGESNGEKGPLTCVPALANWAVRPQRAESSLQGAICGDGVDGVDVLGLSCVLK